VPDGGSVCAGFSKREDAGRAGDTTGCGDLTAALLKVFLETQSLVAAKYPSIAV